MPAGTTLLLFSTTALLLIMAPGPNFLYVLSRGVGQGRRAALLAAVGLGCGVALHTLAATMGLSALLQSSTLAFLLVKYLGAAYLIYLGIKTLRDRTALALDDRSLGRAPWRMLLENITASITTPKTALFFLTFLPQFVDPSVGAPAPQLLVFGGIYLLLTIAVYTTVGLSAGMLSAWLRRSPAAALRMRQAAGLSFISLGFWAALPEQR
jgi:threonine/homoserine/homoserine lactone efflux protein